MAGLAPGAVSAVFLTGGATRMPCVRECIASAVPDAKLIVGDAFGSVATGLALDAGKAVRRKLNLVIARSEATKQSRGRAGRTGLLRSARNDAYWFHEIASVSCPGRSAA